jgi:hypothetical protein
MVKVGTPYVLLFDETENVIERGMLVTLDVKQSIQSYVFIVPKEVGRSTWTKNTSRKFCLSAARNGKELSPLMHYVAFKQQNKPF